MGFPFITKPFEGWVQDELNNRTKKKLTNVNRFTPFIWLSSGAIVCKGSKRPNTISATPLAAIYNGCIISNTIDNRIKYPTKKSYLGYDLNGKLIEVPNSSRQVSPPIIESMEIDTDGENNTLKIATINITIFSLKQLEMFELFFLRSQVSVVMEYGHMNPDSKIKVAANSFINGKNWKSYVDEVVKYLLPDAASYKKKRDDYLKKIKDTNGDYDFWIGKVTNFNVSYEGSEGVYKVQLQVSSGNELHLWMPIKQQTTTQNKQEKSTTTTAPAAKPGVETWMQQLCGELVLSETVTKNYIKDAGKYKDEFFNWETTSDKTNTENATKERYISMKLILDIMNNVELYKESNEKISTTHFQIKQKDSIPVNSHEYIISTNTDFVIPGNTLPKIIVNKTTREVDIDKSATLDYAINGKSFNYPKGTTDVVTKVESFKLSSDATYGNLLNIFVNKNLFVKLFKDSYTFADFYGNILNAINNLLFGVCKLEIGNYDGDAKGLTIIDKKLYRPKIDVEQNYYRFTNDPLKSIMHEMSFNFELSNTMQAQALYETQLILSETQANKRQGKDGNETAGVASLTDRSFLKLIGEPNGDNMYSIDWVNYKVLTSPEAKNWQQKDSSTNTANDDDSANKESNVEKKLEGVIKAKSIKFPVAKAAPATLIYDDYTFIQSRIADKIPNTSVLTYLECDITIDGMAGFRCGEMFHIDGVPEMYNKKGAFQILNIKQSVQSDTAWRTSINAAFRYNVEK